MFIKICGITSPTDARMAASAGANAVGLNFYPPSPRAVSIERAHELVQSIPPYVEPVGLFVNSTPAQIRALALGLGLKTLQLHGDISPGLVAELREFSVMPSFPVSDEQCVAAVVSFVKECLRDGKLPSAILLDAHVPGSFGGTGRMPSWSLAQRIVEQCIVPVTLAGGLTAKNVAQAIRSVRPWGVDVASGVEVAPGRKESYKVRQFIAEARKAFAEV